MKFIFNILINILISLKFIDLLANLIDKNLDKIQKADSETGKLLRAKLILLANRIKVSLTEEDGIN